MAPLPKSKTFASAPSREPELISALRDEPLPPTNTGLGDSLVNDSDSSHLGHDVPARDYSGVEDLVIVCCHAIFHPKISSPDFPLHSPYDENNWYLAPFQKSNPESGKPGEYETFLSHIGAGLDALTAGSYADKALLVLSGGATKASLTPLSEARSYYHAALANELAQGHQGGGRAQELYTEGRILLEEQATDSFQNLLFSILLFRRTTGAYPKHIRIITHAFKSKRFLELHAPAIKWPSDRIQVQGIDPVMSSTEFEETILGEDRSGYAPWQHDPFGNGKILSAKRKQRGWNETIVQELVEGLEESIKKLVNGQAPGVLPWSISEADHPARSDPTAIQ